MKSHLSRINKMEKALNIGRKNDGVIVILPDFSDDLIKSGYFKDEQEKEAFLTWRVAKLREPGFEGPFGIYLFNEEDVRQHIDAFKHDKPT